MNQLHCPYNQVSQLRNTSHDIHNDDLAKFPNIGKTLKHQFNIVPPLAPVCVWRWRWWWWSVCVAAVDKFSQCLPLLFSPYFCFSNLLNELMQQKHSLNKLSLVNGAQCHPSPQGADRMTVCYFPCLIFAHILPWKYHSP